MAGNSKVIQTSPISEINATVVPHTAQSIFYVIAC